MSVMERNPERFYLSRGDYLDFRTDRMNAIDLSVVATRSGSNKLPQPHIDEDGSCHSPVKPTPEWNLIHGE